MSVSTSAQLGSAKALLISAIQFWKTFDIKEKCVALDSAGSQIQQTKAQSQERRKILAERTKHFRKLSTEDQLGEVRNLVKLYQEEVDALTKRAKYSEGQFFEVYKSFHEAPDPVPILEHVAVRKVLETETQEGASGEVLALRQQLAEYEKEFQGLKNQDITIRELEHSVMTLQAEMREEVDRAVQNKGQEMEGKSQELVADAQERQRMAERQAAETLASTREHQHEMQAMQLELLECRQKHDEERLHYQNELESASQEAQEVRSLRRQTQELRKKIKRLESSSAASSGSDSTNAETPSLMSTIKMMQADQTNQDALIRQLRLEMAQLEQVKAQLQQTSEEMLDQHRYQEAAFETKIRSLESELQTRATVDEFERLEKQLRIFSALQEPSTQHASSSHSEEDVLVQKLRQLENAVKDKDVCVSAQGHELEELRHQLERMTASEQEQVQLIQKLEEDIVHLQGGKILDDTKRTTDTTQTDAQHILSGVLGRPDQDENPRRTTTSQNDRQDEAMMTNILKEQRNRFRDRMKMLEKERDERTEWVSTLNTRFKALERENIELLSQVRDRSMNRSSKALEDGMMMYASTKFDDSVRSPALVRPQRPNRTWNTTVDKLTTSIAQLVIGHRVARWLTLGYFVTLHFLIVSSLFLYMQKCGTMN